MKILSLIALACAGLAISLPAAAQTTPGSSLEPVVNAALTGERAQNVGAVRLSQFPKGLLVSVNVSGLAPGWHGVHFHAMGDCSDAGGHFMTAGGHATQGGEVHGYMNESGPHSGDLPNLFVHADGTGSAEFFTTSMTMNDLRDKDGSALMIHADPDDYRSDPSGNSGMRVACGVISPVLP